MKVQYNNLATNETVIPLQTLVSQDVHECPIDARAAHCKELREIEGHILWRTPPELTYNKNLESMKDEYLVISRFIVIPDTDNG